MVVLQNEGKEVEGGVLRVDEEKATKSVKGWIKELRKTKDMKKVREVQVERMLLVKLQEGDEVRAVEEKQVEGRLRSRTLCLEWSREEVPAGRQSVILTH